MELRHLHYFLAVAEAGNVTRAAERCFVAQSALSAQIARLEAELGSKLFVRSRRGVRLTVAGEALRPLATRILAEVTHAEEEMAALRGLLGGRLRLGMIQGAPADLDLVALIAAFHDRHPAIELRVRTGASDDLARAVLDGTLDLAIVALREPDLPPALVHRALADDQLMAVLAATVTGRPPEAISVRDLLERGPFIHYRRGSGLRHSVNAAFERAGVEVEAQFELDQITDMVRLAALGVGVTIVPASVLRPPAAALGDAPPLRAVPLTDPAALHTLSVITPQAASRAAQAFLALLNGPPPVG